MNPTDQDVLAVVNSAYLLRYLGVYTVSRFPGYPVYEIINSLFIGGGWVATNMATVVVSFICVLLFIKILYFFKIENISVLVLTFAFIPVIWINSTVTIDYMWSLMFILSGCYLLFSRRYFIAGMSLGLAIGTRFTSCFMIIPILYWFSAKKLKFQDLTNFLAGAIGTAIFSFLPVFYKYNLEFLQGSGFIQTTPVRKSLTMLINSISTSFTNLILELFGILTIIALIFLIAISFKNKTFNKSEHKELMNFCWLTIIVFTLIYFIFPYKVAYLIPVVPWGLIILNEKLKGNYTIVVCILLLFNGIISVEISTDNTGEDAFFIKLDSGLVIKNYENRELKGFEISAKYMDSLTESLIQDR